MEKLVNVKTDKNGVDLILKGLRLIRVYQEREQSWITPVDKGNAKKMTDMIEKIIRDSGNAKFLIENPLCDPDTNCDW